MNCLINRKKIVATMALLAVLSLGVFVVAAVLTPSSGIVMAPVFARASFAIPTDNSADTAELPVIALIQEVAISAHSLLVDYKGWHIDNSEFQLCAVARQFWQMVITLSTIPILHRSNHLN